MEGSSDAEVLGVPGVGAVAAAEGHDEGYLSLEGGVDDHGVALDEAGFGHLQRS